MSRSLRIVRFREKSTPITCIRSPLTRWRLRLTDAIWLALGKALRRAVPGAIRNLDYHDELTGQHIRVKVGLLYTCISVDGRDYFFRRYSGRFDGTGTSNL